MKPKRIVTDSMVGLSMPDIDVWSDRVAVVLGRNPGPFTGPGTNTYLIGTGRELILLDAGEGVPEYLALVGRCLAETRGGAGLQELLVTHAHVDHLAGVPGILERFGPLRVSKKPWPEQDCGISIQEIEDGAEVRTEGATLRAVWTPGHARDHLCFHLQEENALFTGDLVLGAGTTVIPPDGDLVDYLHSLERILDLDPAVIYPGHGPAIRGPRAVVEAYIAHRALREEQIVEGLRDGVRTIRELVKRIYTDVPAFLHPAAGMSVEAHLRKLEREAVTECDGAEWFLK